MSIARLASFAGVVLLFGTSFPAYSDPPANGSGPYADGKVIQAVGSQTVASRVLRKTSFQPTKGQIKFGIEILSVDTETRDKIYAALDPKNVKTRIVTVSDQAETPKSLDEADDPLACKHTITTGSVVSTAVLNQTQLEELYEVSKGSDASTTVSRPNLIAGDGQPASYQQRVQRPFLSNLERVEQGDSAGIHSAIQVLNEGTEVTVMATVDGEALNVHATIEYAQVSDVKQKRVYGLSDDQHVIQVPSHQIRQATASQRLLAKQTLLLDPYFESHRVKSSTVSAPLLDQIPYVGEAFTTTETEEVTLHTLVLLKAKQL